MEQQPHSVFLTLSLPWQPRKNFSSQCLYIDKTSRQVMRIKKNVIRGLVVDQIPNFPNYHHKNWMADSTENYYWDLGTERVKLHGLLCQTATYTFSLKSQLQIKFYTKPHPKSVALMFGYYKERLHVTHFWESNG